MFDRFPIAPQTDEEKKDCETPDGIRRRLRKVYYHYSDPTIVHVMRLAEARGMSGEDMYTVMAFEALKHMEDMQKRLLDVYNTMPAKHFIPKEPLNTGDK
jgi:hypothetical protein